MDQLVNDFNTALDETAGSGSARFEEKLRSSQNNSQVWGVAEKSLEETMQINEQPCNDYH